MEAGTLKLEDIEKKIEQLSPEEAQKELEAGDATSCSTRASPTSTPRPTSKGAVLVPPSEVAELARAEEAPDTSRSA